MVRVRVSVLYVCMHAASRHDASMERRQTRMQRETNAATVLLEAVSHRSAGRAAVQAAAASVAQLRHFVPILEVDRNGGLPLSLILDSVEGDAPHSRVKKEPAASAAGFLPKSLDPESTAYR